MRNYSAARNGLTNGTARRSLFAVPAHPGEDARAASGLGHAPHRTETPPLRPSPINHLLAALPADEFERLSHALEPVVLTPRENLRDAGEARHVYFPEEAVVSQLVVFEDGTTVETALTGREGAVGLGAVLNHGAPTHWQRVTLPGVALRMRAEHFRHEFAACEGFRAHVLEYAGRHVAHLSQRGACVIRHRLENRLATWLLMLDDRAAAPDLPLTQEYIAQCIGARRAGISEVISALQSRGLIGHTRGVVRVLDRHGLEAAACECYAILRSN